MTMGKLEESGMQEIYEGSLLCEMATVSRDYEQDWSLAINKAA